MPRSGIRGGRLSAQLMQALVLPAITLALFQLTLIKRLVRAQMLEALRTDHIRFARARGLPDRLIHSAMPCGTPCCR